MPRRFQSEYVSVWKLRSPQCGQVSLRVFGVCAENINCPNFGLNFSPQLQHTYARFLYASATAAAAGSNEWI